MCSSDLIRSAVVGTLLLALGPVLVVLSSGLRGGWILRGSLPGPGNVGSSVALWPPERWLLDPATLVVLLGSFLVILVVDLRGGVEAAGFQGAIRLTPVAFALPAAAVLVADTELPPWLAWRATTWGTSMGPMELHAVVLELARPGALVGILVSALLVGTSREDGELPGPGRSTSLWGAAGKTLLVFGIGFETASFVAVPVAGMLFGPWTRGPAMALVLLPTLFVSVCLWYLGWLRPAAHDAALRLPTAWLVIAVLALAAIAAVGQVGVLHAAGLASY